MLNCLGDDAGAIMKHFLQRFPPGAGASHTTLHCVVQRESMLFAAVLGWSLCWTAWLTTLGPS